MRSMVCIKMTKMIKAAEEVIRRILTRNVSISNEVTEHLEKFRPSLGKKTRVRSARKS